MNIKKKTNANKYIKILIITMFICFGIGNAIVYFTGGYNNKGVFIGKSKEMYNINDEKIQKINGVKTISVKGNSEHIHVIAEDRKDVKAHLYGKVASIGKPELVVSKSGEKIEIEVKYLHSVNIELFENADFKLDVFVPKNYKDDFKVDLSAGAFEMEEELTLNDFSIELSSGDVSLKNLMVNNFEMDMTSGDFVGDHIHTNNMRIELSSGEVQFNNFIGNIEGDITSGSVDVNYAKFDHNIDLEVTSGEIDLDLPDHAQFYLDSEAISGDIECDFPITVKGKYEHGGLKGVVGSDKNKIKLKLTSGDVNIR